MFKKLKSKSGEVITLVLIAAGAIVLHNVFVASFNFDIYKPEGGKIKASISLTELTKDNGKIIWCKMKGKSNCDAVIK